jgi:hypothetical protein
MDSPVRRDRPGAGGGARYSVGLFVFSLVFAVMALNRLEKNGGSSATRSAGRV